MPTIDPPRILEPGKWGSKVRGLAHVQGYRGPQGYFGAKMQVPVPNLSTASRLGRFQVPNLSTSSRFFKHFIFRFAVGRKIVKLWRINDRRWNQRQNDGGGKRRDAGTVCRKPAAADAQCTRSRAACRDVRAIDLVFCLIVYLIVIWIGAGLWTRQFKTRAAASVKS